MPSIRLFKVLGIRISIDYTWFIVFALFTWSLAYGYFPTHTPGLSVPSYVIMGAVSSFLLFACVLVHELSHSYVANRLGLDIKEITLFIFGGVARLTREPDDAKVELKIAIAGPLASIFLAGFFTLLEKVISARLTSPPLSGVLNFLAMINMVLVIFNMIPGFPLDGGRILRAIWWLKTGNVKSATRLTSSIGKGFAIFLIIFGFVQIISGAFIQGLWAILIGGFLQHAADTSYRQLLMKLTLEGVRVKDVMTKNVITIDANATVEKAIEEYFFHYHFVSLPVTSNGAVVGLVTLNHVRNIKKDAWHSTLIKDVMQAITEDNILSPDDSVTNVFTKMAIEGRGRYPVMDKGKLVGILSRRDIMKVMEFRSEFEQG